MRLFLMCVGWWASGFTACHIVYRLAVKIDPPCPKSLKCWIGSLIALAYGLGEYVFMPMLKPGYSSPEFLLTMIFAATVGVAVMLVLCPIHSFR